MFDRDSMTLYVVDRNELFDFTLKWFQCVYKDDVINRDIVIQFCKNATILESDINQIFKDNNDLDYNVIVYGDCHTFGDNKKGTIQYLLYDYIMKNM